MSPGKNEDGNHKTALWSIFRWGIHLYMSLFPSVSLSVCLSVCCTPYLRNHTSSNHNFWYTCVKRYLPDFFSFFWSFHFGAVSGVQGSNYLFRSDPWRFREKFQQLEGIGERCKPPLQENSVLFNFLE